MTKPAKRRSSSTEHRSTKRRKTSPQPKPIYSTRYITWEEQKTLPPRFRVEKDVWPASKILQQRLSRGKTEYLVEWEEHPTTGEIFEPTWEPASNLAEDLKQEWYQTFNLQASPTNLDDSSPPQSLPSKQLPTNVAPSLTSIRKTRNRRIIPDSSGDTEGIVINDSASSRTPTLIESPGSNDSVPSPIEISETQELPRPTNIRVTVPPVPSDKSDWESLRESQLGSYHTAQTSSSPFVSSLPINIGASQHTPAVEANTRRTPVTTSAGSLLSSSSTNSRPSTGRNRAHGIRRILDYQSVEQISSSTGDLSSRTKASSRSSTRREVSQPLTSDTAGLAVAPATKTLVKTNGDSLLPRATQSRNSHRPAPVSSSTHSASNVNTQPWVFKTQISLQYQSPLRNIRSSPQHSGIAPASARTSSSHISSQRSNFHTRDHYGAASNAQNLSPIGMAARGTRQSPRLQTAVPHATSTTPRIAVRTNSYRARSGGNPPEHSSPLAATAELVESDSEFLSHNIPESSFINNLSPEQTSSDMSQLPPTSIAPSAMHIDPTVDSVLGRMSQESIGYDAVLNTLPTPVQESIEEELMSSAEEASLASKASSSQESLRNEKPVPHIEGMVMPTYPILGSDEYAIALPAEGKVQAIYSQTIKAKRNALLKFIRRRGSVNTASTSTKRTVERNEMIELIARLHNITTHMDLGLPGSATQYTIPSSEHATYAEYAGSKFVFLGYLLDYLQRRHETVVIMAKSGVTHDLIEEYLSLKNVKARRHESVRTSQQLDNNETGGLQIEILSTRAHEIVQISGKPSLIIAFDASFESLDPQVKSLRAQTEASLPILHLLVTNSSEHVERCLPASMPSPMRLRLLVRATYQGHMNLGGSPTIITNASDGMDGRPMDLADISKAVRKSPNRRLQMVAAVVANAVLSDDFGPNWTLDSMPELALDELSDSPSTGSTVSATPGRTRNRSQTPILRATGQLSNRSQTPASRATTPSARKRQLEPDSAANMAKRQRITPVNDVSEGQNSDVIHSREQELQLLVDTLRNELTQANKAREVAEQAREAAEKERDEWNSSLAILQRRYEKRRQKTIQQSKENQALKAAIENSKSRVEKINSENLGLRQKILEQKKELEAARTDLKSAGGDTAVLEIAREEARTATAKVLVLEKSLESHKRDFEFLREQYQVASNKAHELVSQVNEHEKQLADFKVKASDEKRRLKEMNTSSAMKQDLGKITQLEAEKKSIIVMYKKLEEENKLLKRNRGVQTRGSSTAPGSPGQRSRQGSPALGVAPPSGSRAAVLRHER